MSSSSTSSFLSRAGSRTLRGGARTRSPSLSAAEAVPSLQEFLHRQTVLAQYRDCLKALRRVSDPADRASLARQVEEEFRRHQSETDPLTIRMAVTDGTRKLKQLQSMVGHSPTTASSSPSQHHQTSEEEQEESWLNTKDPEDPRGRVGVDWPWEQKER